MKVFRLNDCDWVAAETLDQAVEWYMKETGLDREGALDPAHEPHECNLNETIWGTIDYLNDEEKQQARYYKEWDGELYARIPFSRIIEKDYKGEPFIIASVDY